MITGDRAGSINQLAPFSKTAYHAIKDTTGIKFGEACLRHLESGTMILNSEKPSIALSVFKSIEPEAAETSFYLIAKGFTDLDTLELRIINVQKEISN
ncbi:MAG: hypothetical protein WC220_14035, partial [Pedobacter sp.]|jgi:protein-disulfide isomerase-like protein with CxxC motif